MQTHPDRDANKNYPSQAGKVVRKVNQNIEKIGWKLSGVCRFRLFCVIGNFVL